MRDLILQLSKSSIYSTKPKKFAMAAAQMGARYYVITGLSNNNYAFGNADIYE
ncbi:hypothetical protein V9Y22_23970 [Klebsiella pneumoniae]|uniref:hypothetical protein n=1 Tax=Klebsiella pneumoniae TaxID=573 RepID=UPI00312DB000